MFARLRSASLLSLSTLLWFSGGCAFLSGMTTSAAPASSPNVEGSSAPEHDTTFASAPSTASAEPTEAAPAVPTTVSVKLRNGCGDTVKVFFGDKPKFGSGTYSSLSGNSSTNHTFRPGDMFWIVDDSQNGLSSITVDASTKTIEVDGTCGSLSAR